VNVIAELYLAIAARGCNPIHGRVSVEIRARPPAGVDRTGNHQPAPTSQREANAGIDYMTAQTATNAATPQTLGELRASGYASRPVREEMRANLIEKIRRGEELFPGVVGYDQTVIPQVENAILSGQDVIFLGERGQAKTRLARSLVNLLDETIPIVAGSEINDDPFQPVSRYAVDLIAERGDDTPIEWVGRDRRYGEKLATPDTTIADLIGEVDPIKVAEGRYLSDELSSP
jgi:magnesium chelatase subunit I